MILTKFSRKVSHGLRKKPADFDVNPDHVTSGLARVVITSRKSSDT